MNLIKKLLSISPEEPHNAFKVVKSPYDRLKKALLKPKLPNPNKKKVDKINGGY